MEPRTVSLRAGYALSGALFILLASAWSGTESVAGTGTTAPGRKAYLQRCAGCHGANGQGGSGYSRPLTGARNVEQLASYIAGNMPPGPKHAPAAEAKLIASDIYTRFYSPLARAHSQSVRITLSRLTVRQFRNAVADLIGSFRGAPGVDARQGLHGEYFKNRDFDDKDRLIDRIDPVVQFNFGTSGPIPDKFDPHHFSIRWQGSVLAPETGDYEFMVHTEHAVRLWVNDEQTPLIDQWVKSGSDTDYRADIMLLGGRTYSLRLEFSKSTQGVDDSKEKQGKPAPPASIALFWKRPGMAEEPIPARCLAPSSPPETYVVSNPFPPDDASMGFERGTSVSKDWDEAITAAALDASEYVVKHLRDLSGVPDDAKDRAIRLQDFCRRFVERAFSRPLTPDVQQLYIGRQFQVAPDLHLAVRRVVLLTLSSPRFLYRDAGIGRADGYTVAERLSFGLWDSLPDQELVRAAGAGELSTPAQVAQQAQRMLADPRAWSKLRQFLMVWLKVDPAPELAKSKAKYPEFDPAFASDLRTSLELFLKNTLDNDTASYRDLMLSPTLYLNGRLSKVYGGNLPADAPFQAVACSPAERCGVLTQPYLLSRFAYIETSSPIHRGVLITRNLLGRILNPPPAAFAPLAASLHPDMTTRQRVSLQTKPAFCSGCHGLINPLGFTLERYDAIGKLRASENGHPIDCTGTYHTLDGKQVNFGGAQDLAHYLADSDEAHAAFVQKLFLHLLKQPAPAYGPHILPDLEKSFVANDYNVRKLMVNIMTATALQGESGAQAPMRVGRS